MNLERSGATILLLTSLMLTSGHLVTVQASEAGQRVAMACSFLKSLYNSTLQLVRETSSVLPQVYHVASDNLLAWKALSYCDDVTGQSIRTAITRNACCKEGNDSMHEAVLGVPIPLPIHVANVYDVTRFWPALSGSYSVVWENHNGTGTVSPYAYADVAAYTALQMELSGNRTGAMEMVGVLNEMWDGKGMIDEAYKNGTLGELGIYQTFKVALYLLLLKRLSFATPSGLMESLGNVQGPDGGFHTGYAANMTYAGTEENAETTSLAIIALGAFSEPDLFYVSEVLASSVVLVALLFILNRRRLSRRSLGPSNEKGSL